MAETVKTSKSDTAYLDTVVLEFPSVRYYNQWWSQDILNKVSTNTYTKIFKEQDLLLEIRKVLLCGSKPRLMTFSEFWMFQNMPEFKELRKKLNPKAF